jgi:hypothetical protein
MMRLGVRAGSLVLVVAVVTAIVAGRTGDGSRSPVAVVLPESVPASPVDSTEAPASAESSGLVRTAAALPAPKPKAPAVAERQTPLPALVRPGRTEVGDGLYIERAGETVTVHFDTPEARTRRRDKFERVVRRTLPEIYGSAAEALLSSIPEGTLVEPVDLVTEVAERGVKLDAGDGWKVSLWPETRPGQDGPLVLSYRVAVTR